MRAPVLLLILLLAFAAVAALVVCLIVWAVNSGRKQREQSSAAPQAAFGQSVNTQDVPSGGMNVLGFFFPVIGLILYLVWKDQTPRRANAVGKTALIGFVVWTVLSVLLSVLAVAIPLLLLSFE